MRTAVIKAMSVAIIAMVAFGFAAPIAAAQDYPPVPPIQAAGEGIVDFTGPELLFLINGNNASNAGDVVKTTEILLAAKRAGADPAVIARLEAAVNNARENAPASVPAAPPLAVPAANLAFTGSSASLPAALGATMIGVGGLTVLFARKRELRHG